MFTGIIQALTPVIAVFVAGEVLTVRIKKPRGWKLKLGQSLSVDGICSTVTALRPAYFEVEYMPETRAITTAEAFKKGTLVNLERSLALRDPIDGHLVQGHIDTRGTVVKITTRGETKEMTISFPHKFSKYIIEKGSISINGISLTVVRVTKDTCTVALIPYTLSHTSLGGEREGGSVNIETDIIARYVERMILDK